jgi:hypothetical protein
MASAVHEEPEDAPFSATWSDTLEILERELSHLGAPDAVIQVAADERAVRLDGGLRADAKGHASRRDPVV